MYRTVDRSKADIVLGVDGKKVETLDELLTAVEQHKPGDEAVLKVWRDGKLLDVPVKLAESKQ